MRMGRQISVWGRAAPTQQECEITALEAMKQALEALDVAAEKISCPNDDDEIAVARTNLRAAIEQMEKAEPSVWLNLTTKDCTFNPHTKDNWLKQGHVVKPYYKHPAPAVPEGEK